MFPDKSGLPCFSPLCFHVAPKDILSQEHMNLQRICQRHKYPIGNRVLVGS